MLKGGCIEKILCGIGLHKTLTLTAVRSVGVLLSPDGYRDIGVENLEVLLILRRKCGKCRSHTHVFWVYGTMDTKLEEENTLNG